MRDARLSAPAAVPFDHRTRAERIAALGDERFDVLVVGGGITGAGVARDAAMRGLRTALIERDDLASGTSSASSKLVHGGLRYLEQGAVRLVYESVSERHRLRQLAPHLVRPLPFVFPVYEGRPRPLWMVGTGLWIYDAMALFRSPELHRTFRGDKAAELEPALRQEGLDGAIRYYDCLTDDARLTLETARGAHDAGAWVLPYLEVTRFTRHRGQVSGAELLDHVTGAEVRVEARVVINATGPWTDRTLGLLGERQRLLRPTKGVHLVLPRARLPARHAVVLTNPADRRVVFVIPWGNRIVLGTTDTDYDGDFDDVHCTRQDVDYLLALANHYFPERDLVDADVLGTWAGLRPLIASDGGPSEVSREHLVQQDDDGLITVAGGKLTTYRLMGAEVVDLAARRLRLEGLQIGGSPTASVMLPGGAGIAYRGDELITLGPDGAQAEQELEQRLGVDVAEHLQESYGGRWTEVAARTADRPDLAARIVDDLPYLWAELDHAIEQELCVTLRDFMRRRTQLEIRACDASRALARTIAAKMAGPLGWDPFQVDRQVTAYLQRADASMAWRDAPR